MSNLLKSKFLIGVMTVAVMFVGVVALNATSASADCTVVPTVKVGSKGESVKCVQMKVGVTADGSFGPKTMAAVVAWQREAGLGLVADGIVGAKSAAAMNGSMMSTGALCPNGMLLSNNCAAAPATGGALCPNGMTLASNCVSGSSTGPLTGGAGSLDDVQSISSLSGEEVAEGESDVKVAGWTFTADNGSDLAVSTIRLSFDLTAGAGSDKFDDYADKVAVWQGSKKVGSADVADFSENSNVYSKTINLSGVSAIKADGDSDFYVTVDALNNIDSSDLGANTWTMTLESVRYEDATGVVSTETSTGDIGGTTAFSFESVATAAGTELKVSTTTGSSADLVNDGHVVEIDTTSDTNDVPLLAFDLKATGDIQNIQDVPVKLVSTGTGQITDIASSFSLWMDGTQIDTVSSADLFETSVTENANLCDNDDTTCWVHFDDVDFDMNDGDSAHFLVKADINDTSATLVNGDTLTASMTATDVDAIDAEDQNGDAVAAGDLTGTATADSIAFYSEGMNAKYVSSSAVATPSGVATVDDTGTFTITFDVTAFGSDIYVDGTAIADETGGATYQDIDASTTSVAAGVIDCTGCDDGANTTFKVVDGTTERFVVTIAGSGADVFSSASLTSILYATTAIDGDTLYTFNMGDYTTSSVWLDSN